MFGGFRSRELGLILRLESGDKTENCSTSDRDEQSFAQHSARMLLKGGRIVEKKRGVQAHCVGLLARSRSARFCVELFQPGVEKS